MTKLNLSRIRTNLLTAISRVLRAVSLWGMNATYLFMITLVISVLSLIAAAAMFMRPGLPDLLGGLLANYCLISGQCDLNLSMAGLAVALIAMAHMLVLFMAFMFWNFPDDTEALEDDDLTRRLDAIDGRLAKQSELLDILLLPTEITPDDIPLPEDRNPDWLKSLNAER